MRSRYLLARGGRQISRIGRIVPLCLQLVWMGHAEEVLCGAQYVPCEVGVDVLVGFLCLFRQMCVVTGVDWDVAFPSGLLDHAAVTRSSVTLSALLGAN